MICGLFLVSAEAIFANPGQLFAERKAELVRQYDTNKDGRLDVRERLAMREAIIAGKVKGEGRNRGRGMIPPEIIEAFDKNKDGSLDEKEQQEMNSEMGRRFGGLMQRYDQNKDGELKAEEVAALRKDSREGDLEGLDALVARFLLMQFGGGGANSKDEKSGWSRFDRDGDGLASAEELEAIRKQQQQP